MNEKKGKRKRMQHVRQAGESLTISPFRPHVSPHLFPSDHDSMFASVLSSGSCSASRAAQYLRRCTGGWGRLLRRLAGVVAVATAGPQHLILEGWELSGPQRLRYSGRRVRGALADSSNLARSPLRHS